MYPCSTFPVHGFLGSGNGEKETHDKTRVSHQHGFQKCQEVLCFIKTCTVSQSYRKKLRKLPPVAKSLRRFPLKAIYSQSRPIYLVLLFHFHIPLVFTAEGLNEIEEIEEIDKEIKETQQSLQKKCYTIFGLKVVAHNPSKRFQDGSHLVLWKQLGGGWFEVQGTYRILSKHSRKYKLYQSLTWTCPTTYCCIWKPRSFEELKHGIPCHLNNMIVTVILQTEVPLHF